MSKYLLFSVFMYSKNYFFESINLIVTMSTKAVDNKRKRSRNTSSEQYQLYLQYIENDTILRTGTINPTVDSNYLKHKWEDLSEKLNSIGSGAVLSVEEWQKRFSDWKYAVRSKYRKISSSRIKTGSGPQIKLEMTELENRALDAWGRVVLTGSPLVTQYDGIPVQIIAGSQQIGPENRIEENVVIDNLIQTENLLSENEKQSQLLLPDRDQQLPEQQQQQPASNEKEHLPKNRKSQFHVPQVKGSKKRNKSTPLSDIAQELINKNEASVKNSAQFNNILLEFSLNYTDIEKEKLKLARQKLKFEIAKYKFENKEFNYNEEE